MSTFRQNAQGIERVEPEAEAAAAPAADNLEAVWNHDVPLVAPAAADSRMLVLLQQVLVYQAAFS